VKLSEDDEVEVTASGIPLAPNNWQQQLRDAICVSFAGMAAQQAGGHGR
jgi:hypothetical protein